MERNLDEVNRHLSKFYTDLDILIEKRFFDEKEDQISVSTKKAFRKYFNIL
jgi:hypothetical protein